MPLKSGACCNILKADPLATPGGFLDKAPEPAVTRAELMAVMKERDVDPQQFMSAWIDAQLGAVMDQLEKSGLAENTLFLLVSDWLSVGFHVFALVGLAGGLSASRKILATSAPPKPEPSYEPITP